MCILKQSYCDVNNLPYIWTILFDFQQNFEQFHDSDPHAGLYIT